MCLTNSLKALKLCSYSILRSYIVASCAILIEKKIETKKQEIKNSIN